MATAGSDLVFSDILVAEMAAILDYSKHHQRGDATGRAVLEALMDLSAKRTPDLSPLPRS